MYRRSDWQRAVDKARTEFALSHVAKPFDHYALTFIVVGLIGDVIEMRLLDCYQPIFHALDRIETCCSSLSRT